MITKFPEEGLWFTSDTHFNHNAILNFCNRPFDTIEEHDQQLINNWNSVVKPDDTVFHLGDFCFGGRPKWQSIIEQLNGHIILILGNHDFKQLTQGIEALFDYVTQQMKIQIGTRTVYLNHFPFLCFANGNIQTYKENYNIQLFGHIHSGPKSTSEDLSRCSILYPTQYDVGVDNNNLTPVSWNQIKQTINQQINIHNENPNL